MPVLTRGELHTHKLPWMEIDDFEFFVLGRTPGHARPAAAPAAGNGHTPFWGTYQLSPDATFRDLQPECPRQRLVVLHGEVSFESETSRHTMRRRDFVEVQPSGARVTNVGTSSAELALISGRWTRVIRNEICLFRPDKPCDYHYHDGDEYWFVFRGHFTLNYDGHEYDMRLYTLLNTAAKDTGLLAAAKARNMGTLVPAPFGGNVLATGASGDRPLYMYRPAIPEVVAAVQRMEARCTELGVTLAVAALAFVLTQPLVDVTIVGLARPQEVFWNVPACTPGVTREQLQSIREAGRIDPALIGGPDFKPAFAAQR